MESIRDILQDVSFCPEQGNGFLNRKQRLDEYMGYKTLEEMPDDMRDLEENKCRHAGTDPTGVFSTGINGRSLHFQCIFKETHQT